MGIAHPDVDIDILISRCAKSLGKAEAEWSPSDRSRAKRSIEKAAARAAA